MTLRASPKDSFGDFPLTILLWYFLIIGPHSLCVTGLRKALSIKIFKLFSGEPN